MFSRALVVEYERLELGRRLPSNCRGPHIVGVIRMGGGLRQDTLVVGTQLLA